MGERESARNARTSSAHHLTLDRAAARERAERATPGPWQHGYDDGSGVVNEWGGATIIAVGVDEIVVAGGRDSWGSSVGVEREADADFIAHARTDLPAALDELDATDALLRDALPYVESALDAWAWEGEPRRKATTLASRIRSHLGED